MNKSFFMVIASKSQHFFFVIIIAPFVFLARLFPVNSSILYIPSDYEKSGSVQYGTEVLSGHSLRTYLFFR